MKASKWVRRSVVADRFAPVFWIVLIVYGIYEIVIGYSLGSIPLVIGVGALLVDTILIVQNRKMK
jgi:hypothetical protein